MRFRLLEAEIPVYPGRRLEVIALHNCPGVPYPASGDAAIKINLLCGLSPAPFRFNRVANGSFCPGREGYCFHTDAVRPQGGQGRIPWLYKGTRIQARLRSTWFATRLL